MLVDRGRKTWNCLQLPATDLQAHRAHSGGGSRAAGSGLALLQLEHPPNHCEWSSSTGWSHATCVPSDCTAVLTDVAAGVCAVDM